MQSIIDLIENSPLAEMIGKIDRGEHVDVERVLALQSLTIARAGELFAIESIKQERASDDQFIRSTG